MKKKLLAMLLTLCMVTAMVAGLGISAYAADDISADTTVGYIIPYKLASGDTVGKVCQKLGVDFTAHRDEITRINAITNYNNLPVGKIVWIPVDKVGSATDYYTLKAHVVSSGDTLAGICAQYGVATGDALLSRLNNATITVGSTLTVPVFKGDNKNAIVTPGSAAPTTPAVSGGTVISTGTTGTGTTATTTVAGDALVYYLVPYTMKSGDTVAKVCASLGIDFAANQNLITRANNIVSYSTIPAGRTLLLPCTSVPVSGTCYKVMAHTLVAGDTMYKLCQGYGISYGNSLTLLKALNNSNNLNYVKAGNIVYIPVPATVVAGTGTGAGSVISGTTGVTSPSTSYYTVTKESAKNGSYTVKIAGAEVSAVAAGKTVTIVCSGNSGYVQDVVSVVSTDDSCKVVTVSNNTFVMPEYPVTVSVTFKPAKVYTISATNSNPFYGSFDINVNGVNALEGYEGAKAKVVWTANDTYTLNKIEVTKESDPKVKVAVASDGSFTMPAFNTKVTVSFKAGSNFQYGLAGTNDGKGTFDFVVNKKVVNKAAAGSTVSLSTTPNAGYRFDYMELTYDIKDENGALKTVTEKTEAASFKMPTLYDETKQVAVKAFFILKDVYSVSAYTYGKDGKLTNSISNGSISFKVNGKTVDKTEQGRTVEIVGNGKTGYEIDLSNLKFYKYNKTSKAYDIDVTTAIMATVDLEKHTFVMPDGAVRVIVGNEATAPAFKPYASHNIYISANTAALTSSRIDVTVTVKALTSPKITNDTTAVGATTGNAVIVNVVPQNVNTSRIKSITVRAKNNPDNKAWNVSMNGSTFIMPAYDVEIEVEAEYTVCSIGVDADSKKFFKDKYDTAGTDIGGEFQTIDKAVSNTPTSYVKPGHVVTIANIKTSHTDYRVKNFVIYKDGDKDTTVPVKANANGTWEFTMPDYNVIVLAQWTITDRTITKMPSEHGHVAVVGGDPVKEIAQLCEDEVSVAQISDYVYIKPTPNEGYAVKSVKMVDANGNEYDLIALGQKDDYGYFFTMPASSVKVYVEFEVQTYKLTIPKVEAADGTLLVKIGDTVKTAGTSEIIETVKYGETVSMKATAAAGKVLEGMAVYEKSSHAVTVALSENSFTMPAYDSVIEVNFRGYRTLNGNKVVGDLDADDSTNKTVKVENGTFKLYDVTAGAYVTFTNDTFTNTEGHEIRIEAVPGNDCQVDKITVVTIDDNAAVTVLTDSFTVPAKNVKIAVTFKVAE